MTLGGRVSSFGGWTVMNVPDGQAFPGSPAAVVGRLTRPRSDSDGVSAGPVGYLVGGSDGVTGRTVFRSTRVTSRVGAAGQRPDPAGSLKTRDPG